MNRLDCAGHAPAISLLAALAILFGASAVDARSIAHRSHAVSLTHSRHAAVPVPVARPALDAGVTDPALTDSGVVLSDPTLSIVAEDKRALADTPTIVRPARHVYCVEFARLASGIALFGDARTWWDQAHTQYAQIANPAPGAVMVFAGRKNMRAGHVAVVKRLVSAREVLVDHANWGRDGRIYLNAPVIDVSPNNDWSQVKVWNTRANAMGTTAYSLRGFIAQRFASN
jgi:hypothetical protein